MPCPSLKRSKHFKTLPLTRQESTTTIPRGIDTPSTVMFCLWSSGMALGRHVVPAARIWQQARALNIWDLFTLMACIASEYMDGTWPCSQKTPTCQSLLPTSCNWSNTVVGSSILSAGAISTGKYTTKCRTDNRLAPTKKQQMSTNAAFSCWQFASIESRKPKAWIAQSHQKQCVSQARVKRCWRR